MTDIVLHIHEDDLKPIQEEGGKFVMQQSAEQALIRLKQYKKDLEEVENKIKDYLTTEMEKLNTLRIEGERIKVYRMAAGSRYEIADPNLAVQMGFAEKKEVIKLLSTDVAKYIKETGELPDGIKLRERALKVSIREVGEKEVYE